MTVSHRIYAGFFIVTLLAGVIFVVGLLGFNAVNGRVQYVAETVDPLRNQMDIAKSAMADLTIVLLQYSRESQLAQLDTLERKFNEKCDRLMNALSLIASAAENVPTIRDVPQEVLEKASRIRPLAQAMFSAHRQELQAASDTKASDRRFSDAIDNYMASINSNRTLPDEQKSELKKSIEFVIAMTNAAKGKSSSIEIAAEKAKIATLMDRLQLMLAGEPKLERSFAQVRASAIGDRSLLTSIAARIEHVKVLGAAIADVEKISGLMTEQTETLTSAIATLADQGMQYTLDEATNKRILLITFAAIILATAAVVSALVIRSILPPLHEAIRVAGEVAGGNLRVTIDTHRQDELGQLSRAMQKLVSELKSILSQINGGADQLAAAAEQFSIMSEQSNSYATQQLEEMQSFAASIVEMSASVEHIAKSSNETLGAVGLTRSEVVEGQHKMEAHVANISALASSIELAGSNIDQLSEVSARIGSILDAIRSIADQTNLLALNAAIEAARAGEQGRGFAVVADEVRTLASRTGASTTEIQGMIERLQSNMRHAVQEMGNSRQNAQSGMNEVVQAKESFTRISVSVESIRDKNIQIASATEEQSTVAATLAKNVAHISELAESNARTSQENLAVSRSLAKLAEAQRVLAHRFRLD